MNFFKRDVVVLLFVSILIGTALARIVSYGANIYFQETLVSLVGDYGEYDLVLQMREDYASEGKIQLEQVLKENFGEAIYKEGPKIIGKANFFIVLPKEKKNQAIYENIDRLFSSIPGVSGVSILTEPRLTIRGIPPGSIGALEEEFKGLNGVDFVYRNGNSIGIVLDGIEKIAQVTNQTERILRKNKIVDISFPVGIEPENPVLLAEDISKNINIQLKSVTARYVSVDTSNDDMAYLIGVMQEIRKFLINYATKVIVFAKKNSQLAIGDTVVFSGDGRALQSGEGVGRNDVIVLITSLNKDGSFTGILTQGDVNNFSGQDGYLIKENKVSKLAGTAEMKNPRINLIQALQASANLMEKVPLMLDGSKMLDKKLQDTTLLYYQNADTIQQIVTRIDQAAQTMQVASDKLENANLNGFRMQLSQSLKSMNALLGALKLIGIFQPDVANAVENLRSTQEKMQSLQTLLEGMDQVATDAVQANRILREVAQESQNAMEHMRTFDQSQFKADLEGLQGQIKTLSEVDFTQFAAEMRTLAEQAPKLSDEEIYRSVRLMDKVIEGQIIPGKKLQIMVDRSVPIETVKPIVYMALGHENASVYETDLGVIEPNIYLQVYQVLREVQAVLAGFTALVLTLVFLALDHTAVMSALRNLSQRRATGKSNFFWKFFGIETFYGMVVGAVLLSLTFSLSGAGIPYLRWYTVPFIGMVLGFGMSKLTEKITPISHDEVLAGESLGMSFEEIMREIIIPGARPGLLQYLNRRKLYFKE